MNEVTDKPVSLKFRLDVEDEWPPVAVESLPFRRHSTGLELLTAPLYIKGLSVGDVISADLDGEGFVEAWQHVSRSRRSTIWLLRLKRPNQIEDVLARLRAIGCYSVAFDSGGSYAVDVPETISMADVDAILAQLDAEEAAVAFPSMRHPES